MSVVAWLGDLPSLARDITFELLPQALIESAAAMSEILDVSQQCLQAFDDLASGLVDAKSAYVEQMPSHAIHSQYGKYRIWCGNLGALQQGYSSLDYRLRESQVMLSNVAKLLQQLHANLKESIAVISGARVPFEQQGRPADLSEDDSTDGSDVEDTPRARTELEVRLSSITDLLETLYKLGYKIRDPNLRPTSTKATFYTETDPETNVELFETFARFDEQHVAEMLSSLRSGRLEPEGFTDYLPRRLVASITLRRKYFRYWERHAKKLSRHNREDGLTPGLSRMNLTETKDKNVTDLKVSRAGIEGRGKNPDQHTLLSKTEATKYDAALDDQTEKGTVISSASTAFDAEGNSVALPKPPPEAQMGQDFKCPYCFVLCPAKQGRGAAWKAHVLHDLQPYLCTYENCSESTRLFSSRRRWVEHEETAHRKSWRCYEHPDLLYPSAEGLSSHLQKEHSDQLSQRQIDGLIDLSVVALLDERELCPICFETKPFPKGLANHLANHLERVAIFALPQAVVEAENSTAGSNASKRLGIGSQVSLGSAVSLNFTDRGTPSIVTSNPYDLETQFDENFSQRYTDEVFAEHSNEPKPRPTTSRPEDNQKWHPLSETGSTNDWTCTFKVTVDRISNIDLTATDAIELFNIEMRVADETKMTKPKPCDAGSLVWGEDFVFSVDLSSDRYVEVVCRYTSKGKRYSAGYFAIDLHGIIRVNTGELDAWWNWENHGELLLKSQLRLSISFIDIPRVLQLSRLLSVPSDSKLPSNSFSDKIAQTDLPGSPRIASIGDAYSPLLPNALPSAADGGLSPRSSPTMRSNSYYSLIMACNSTSNQAYAAVNSLKQIRDTVKETMHKAIDGLISKIQLCNDLLGNLKGSMAEPHERTPQFAHDIDVILLCLRRGLTCINSIHKDTTMSPEARWEQIYNQMSDEPGRPLLILVFELSLSFINILCDGIINDNSSGLRASRGALELIRPNVVELALRLNIDTPTPGDNQSAYGQVDEPDTSAPSGSLSEGVHWAERVFEKPLVHRTTLLNRVASKSFGPYASKGSLQIPKDAKIVMRRTFNNDELSLTIFLLQQEPWLQIGVARNGQPSVAQKGAHELVISRETSTTIMLKRWSATAQESKAWAILGFADFEVLVLFYFAFVALKARSPSTISLHPDEFALKHEVRIFQAAIIDDGFKHSLIVYRDQTTECLRLHASVWDGEMKKCPIWTAFITQESLSPKWVVRAKNSKHRLYVSDLDIHVFCETYDPEHMTKQVGGEKKFEIYFVNTEGANRFLELFHDIARSQTDSKDTEGEASGLASEVSTKAKPRKSKQQKQRPTSQLINLPVDATLDDVTALLKGCKMTSVRITPDGIHNATAEIEFVDEAGYSKARVLDRDGLSLRGNIIQLVDGTEEDEGDFASHRSQLQPESEVEVRSRGRQAAYFSDSWGDVSEEMDHDISQSPS